MGKAVSRREYQTDSTMNSHTSGRTGCHATPARMVALSIAGEIRRRKGYARDVLRTSQELRGMDARDVSFVQRLVLGVTLSSGLLDEFIDTHAIRPSNIQPQVRDALRIACYELCYLQTPANTAVNQGVELVRSVVPRAAGMANAILRRVAAQDVSRVAAAHQIVQAACASDQLQAEALTAAPHPTVQDFALTMAAPVWLVQQLIDSIGVQALCDMALCAHEPAPVWVSANSGIHTFEEVRNLLDAAGVIVQDAPFPQVWCVQNAALLTSSKLVKQADVVVSDLAARMVCYSASPEPDTTLLEIGQGRATKSMLLESLAQQAGAPVQLVGVDNSPFKVAVAQRRLEKGWGAYCQSVAYDAGSLDNPAQLPEPLRRNFDLVFVDAPCSGTGTMRRHPEIAWTLTPEALMSTSAHSIPATQLRILVSAASRVQKGGTLVYSTCSVMRQENEDVVTAFLQTDIGHHFGLVSVLDAPAVCALKDQSLQAYELLANCVTDEGMFRSHPKMGSFDGHFCARFVRCA